MDDNTPDTTLPFGQYSGHDIIEVPDEYLFWLADRGRSTYYKSKHSRDVRWQVPIWVWELARKEADSRGYTKIGERWVKKGV